MANLNNVKQQPSKKKCFFDSDIMKCYTLSESNRITGFQVIHGDYEKTFFVNKKTCDVLEAFVRYEKYISKLK